MLYAVVTTITIIITAATAAATTALKPFPPNVVLQIHHCVPVYEGGVRHACLDAHQFYWNRAPVKIPPLIVFHPKVFYYLAVPLEIEPVCKRTGVKSGLKLYHYYGLEHDVHVACRHHLVQVKQAHLRDLPHIVDCMAVLVYTHVDSHIVRGKV